MIYISCHQFKAAAIYASYYGNDAMQNIDPLWRMFQIAELDEVMRQKGDNQLIDMLNKIRTGDLDSKSEDMLKSRFIHRSNPNYPMDALHILQRINRRTATMNAC